MKKVITEHKGNHKLLVRGKLIKFKNGEAEVEDEEAEIIKGLKDKAYKVQPTPKAKKKRTIRKRKAKKK